MTNHLMIIIVINLVQEPGLGLTVGILYNLLTRVKV